MPVVKMEPNMDAEDLIASGTLSQHQPSVSYSHAFTDTNSKGHSHDQGHGLGRGHAHSSQPAENWHWNEPVTQGTSGQAAVPNRGESRSRLPWT